jgi:hypothetical protein
MYFPPGIDDGTMQTVQADWDDFALKALRGPGLCGNITTGWSLENNVPVLDEEGRTSKIFVALIAWPRVEKHMENRELEVFRQNVHKLRELPSLIKMDMFHIHAKTKTAT